jgi:nitrogen fixation NifU-like protein
VKHEIKGEKMSQEQEMQEIQAMNISDIASIKEMLYGSGYSDKAVTYYINKPNMGILDNANQVSELTGPCGDTMKIYLKIENGLIEDAKIQVLGCPGAIASAMAAIEMIKGKTFDEVMAIKDRDIFRMLEDIPNEKQHCIRLTNKTIQKAIEEYKAKQENKA